MSERAVATVSIDGSSIRNGNLNPSAGYGLVIELGDAIAEFKSTLCPTCDRNMQTNNRAELRAAEAALLFLHELAKIGHPRDCRILPCRNSGKCSPEYYNCVTDRRSLDPSDIIGIIRTDSTFVERGATGVNRQVRHKDLWDTVNRTINCLTHGGMDLNFEHVRGHSGDWGNERADDLAREMAIFAANDDFKDSVPRDAACVTCQLDFESLPDLAVHFKKVHMGRDVVEEAIDDAHDQGDASGVYECTLCERELGSGNALGQHLRDKHDC